MADIQYLNYGDQQIEQQALLNNLANNVQNYVQNQSWSTKRKEKFMSAYSDLMNRGIIGASNSTGQWTINVNGDPLPEMSKKDKEMYQEAAYFIQQQMASLPTKQAEEEKKEEEKAKLDIFNNQYFTIGFNTRLANDWFGGASFSRADDWNTLDERGENGLRGFKNRADRLAQSLQNYVDSLDESKLNFEGSAFKNLEDFKSKVGTAIQMLRTDPANAKDALNAIGLKFSDYLYNGAEDVSGYQDKEGNPLTYQQVADVQQKAQEEADTLKAKEAAIAQQQQADANKGILLPITGIHGSDARTNPQGYAEYISKNLGVGQQGFNAMNNLVQNLLDEAYSNRNLSPDKKKQLGNLLYYIREKNPNYQGLGNGQKTNVTLEEFEELKKFQSFGENNIKNMVRLPWQTSDGRYTYADNKGNVYFLKPTNQKKFNAPAVNRSKDYYNYKNNFLKGTSSINQQQRNAYLQSKKDGLTSAEWEELASIGFDIASIVDPEMISSAGLALTGSGLRHHAAASQPGGMSTSDKWWQAADYGLSILGSIPVLGDAALLARATNNLKKAIIPLGLVMAGANVPQAAKAAYNKIVNGQDLTIQDWRAIGAVLTAAVGVGRGRQMSKRAEALRKTGGTTSKNVKEGVIKTSEGEIKVDETTAKQLKEQFKGADGATRTQKLRQNIKVQEAARQQGIDLSKAEVQGHGKFSKSPISYTLSTSTTSGNRIATLRAMSEFNKNHGWLARKGLAEQDWVFRHTGGYTSNSNTGLWQNIKNYFGKSKWDNFRQRQSTSQSTSSNNQNNTSPETLKGPYTPSSPMFNIRRPIKSNKPSYKSLDLNEIKEFENFYLNGQQGKGYGNINYSNPKSSVKEGKLELNFGGEKITLELKSNENMNAAKIGEFRRAVAKQIIPLMKKSFTTEQIRNLQKLKAKGWLKQGGTIDKQRIQQYKEYITK